MNKKTLAFLVFILVMALSSGLAFASHGGMEKPIMTHNSVMMSADQVLKMAPENGFYRFSLEDLKMKVDSQADDFMIVDVRPMQAFKAERIAGSISIPLPTVVDNLKMLDMNKQIYVVCAVDSNSSYATFTLRMYGYKAFMIPGGEVAWKQAGYPVVYSANM